MQPFLSLKSVHSMYRFQCLVFIYLIFFRVGTLFFTYFISVGSLSFVAPALYLYMHSIFCRLILSLNYFIPMNYE